MSVLKRMTFMGQIGNGLFVAKKGVSALAVPSD